MIFKKLLEIAPEFSSLTNQDIEDFERIMCVHEYPAGHEFFKEGNVGNEVHIIINGEVSRTHVKGDKRGSLETIHLRQGDIFGIIAVISEKKHGASYIAVGPVTVATMPSSSFKLLHENNSKLGFHFQQYVVAQLAKDYRALIDSLRRSSPVENGTEETPVTFSSDDHIHERRHAQERRQSTT